MHPVEAAPAAESPAGLAEAEETAVVAGVVALAVAAVAGEPVTFA